MVSAVSIPNRPAFRAQEVCEIAEVQPYVLRGWEAEFPDLGVSKTSGGPRVYRRPDVERVLRIKHLLFVDGLTLAGARRRLGEEGMAPPADNVADADLAAMLDEGTRQQLRNVRRGLNWILGVLSGEGLSPEDFVLRSPVSASTRTQVRAATKKAPAKAKAAKPAKPSKKLVGKKKR